MTDTRADAIARMVEEANQMIEDAYEEDGEPIGVVDPLDTWKTKRYFKKFSFDKFHMRLRCEWMEKIGDRDRRSHREEFQGKDVDKGVAWMADVMQWLAAAIREGAREFPDVD